MLASILINNFNYADFVEASILSAINQDYENCEVIFYDDGSRDDSLKVANNFQDQITIIANENYGRTPCFNQANAIYQAFCKAKGEIIFLLDSDDVFYKNKVERVMSHFIDEPDLILIQHNFDKIDSDGNIVREEFKPILPITSHLKYIQYTHRMEFLFMQTSALAFRRSFLKSVLPIQEDEFDLVWSDVRLTRESLAYGKVKMLDYSLGAYRLHGKNDSDKLTSKKVRQNFQKQHYDWFNSKKITKKLVKRPENRLQIWTSIFKALLFLTFNNLKIRNKVKFARKVLWSRR